MPEVSIIIPVYNAKDYLERCLNSVINQTLKDIEIICVDDASTDNSLEILQKYAKIDDRIKVIHHNINQGESQTRNTGVKNATGEFLAFVDNDDTIDLNFCEILYNKAKKTNADIVKGSTKTFHYNGKILDDKVNKLIKKYKSKLCFYYNWWSAIYKKEIIDKYNIDFPVGYPLGGDVLFLNKFILKADKLELAEEINYNYYRREDSGDSRILPFEKIKSVLAIHEQIIRNIKSANLSDTIGGGAANFWNLKSAINLAFRNKSITNLEYCIDKIFLFYELTKYNLKVEDKFYELIIDTIKRKDKETLMNLYMKNNTEEKMRLSMIRYSMLKKIKNS